MEASRVLLTPEAEEVSTTALTIPEQANAVKIVDADTYVKASGLWQDIRALRAKVKDSFDPIIKKAHEAHRAALDQKAKVDAPLEVAEKTVKKAMNGWDEEQERIRQAEQRRLQEEARKREEEARLQAALDAEKEGAKEEAEAIINEPVYVARWWSRRPSRRLPAGRCSARSGSIRSRISCCSSRPSPPGRFPLPQSRPTMYSSASRPGASRKP